MTVHISGGAAREIIQETAKHIDRVGAEYIPVVVWIIHDTEIGSITPRLGLGLIERDLVAVGRFLECDEFECEIAQHLPDDVLAQYDRPHIDVLNGELVIAEGKAK